MARFAERTASTGGIRPAFVGGVHSLQQHVYDPGVELSPRVLPDLLQGSILGDAVTVRPGANHGVERVRNRNYPRYERDVLPFEPVGVSPAVVAFVVMFDARQRRLHLLYGGEDPDAQGGMLFYHGVLFFREADGLLQDTVGYAYLAHVVQQGPVGQGLHLFLGQGDLAADAQREAGHGPQVLLDVGVFGLHSLDEGPGYSQDRPLAL